jgi:phosphoglycerate kinase
MPLPDIRNTSDLAGKRVLVRLDLNVPVNERGEITDDFRIRRAMPTIDHLTKAHAKVLVASHIESGESSLLPVANYMREHFLRFTFCRELFGTQAETVRAAMQEGEVVLFENIRRFPEEEKNDPAFAERLASLVDMYVNDAFAVSHRAHASIVGVPRYLPSFAGLELQDEVTHLSEAFSPPKPFIFILGGAKFETKLPLLQKFLLLADTVFVGGAIANDLFKTKGYEVGTSLTGNREAGQETILGHENLVLPFDAQVVDANGNVSTRTPDAIGVNESIVDMGPATIRRLTEAVSQAAFVLWNGPLGFYEKGYTNGTESLARAIAESRATSVVGGGDTLAAIKKLELEDKFSFVSTGGGAMLDFLATGTLPGLAALEEVGGR